MPNLPPAPRLQDPQRPPNVFQRVSQGIGSVMSVAMAPVNMLNEGFAVATNAISQVLPSFPAATLGSLVIGIPHAHPAHPPSGPPPVPPTPLPPVGAIMFGTCLSVLIGGMPAARCGDLGANPTCCGLPPFFEVFTGSSKVFIGGSRAARALDVTYHCKPVPPAGAANRALAAAMKAALIAGNVAAASSAIGNAVAASDAAAAGNSELATAMGTAAAVGAAQMANDAVAMAIGAAMGKDPCIPPGTLGAITIGVPTVLIGGFPMPSWMNIAKGLLKLIKGLRARAGRGPGRGRAGRSH